MVNFQPQITNSLQVSEYFVRIVLLDLIQKFKQRCLLK